MQNTKEDYSFGERLLVVAILVLVSIIALNELVQTVKRSEERTIDAATVEYSALRKMYSVTPAGIPEPTIQASVMESEKYPGDARK
jgi:hypothetical protein